MGTQAIEPQGYAYEDAGMTCAHSYLLPRLMRELDGLKLPAEIGRAHV